jgi:hypothetical protein
VRAGLGSALLRLRHLEAVAVELDCQTVRLDTNGTHTDAIASRGDKLDRFAWAPPDARE